MSVWQGVVLLLVPIAIIGFAGFCYWLDSPRRELIAEIKKRQCITINLPSVRYRVESDATDG